MGSVTSMEPIVIDLILIVILIGLNAVFAGSELAIVSIRQPQQARLRAEHGKAGRLVADLAEELTRLLSTVQLGITLGGFLASATAAVSIAAVFADRFTFLGDAAEPVSVIFVTLILTYVTLVLGELVPKRVALKNPERWALRVARPLNMLATAARPIIWGLSKSTDLVASLFRGGKGGAGDSDDLLELIAYQPTLSPMRRKMLTRAYAMHERTVREIVVPRSKVMHVLSEDSVAEALRKVADAGHSRLPVLEDSE